jgi:uncharacterized protein (DUF2147 family)
MIPILTLLLVLNVPPVNEADILLGIWYNGEKDAKIEIYHCGNKYCGKIIWLKEPNENGAPKIDDENPDVKLQQRPIMGLNILTDFIYSGEKTWEDGQIYNPRDGKTYSCYLALQDDGSLKVRGFIGFSLIGKTQYWTRP